MRVSVGGIVESVIPAFDEYFQLVAANVLPEMGIGHVVPKDRFCLLESRPMIVCSEFPLPFLRQLLPFTSKPRSPVSCLASVDCQSSS